MNRTFMLDTNMCSFIMREMPKSVLDRLDQCVTSQGKIIISAITYSEMRFGTIGPKAKPKHVDMVDAFVQRLDGILPWDAAAVDETSRIRALLSRAGTLIGNNDAAIAGHAIASRSVLVTNNVGEFLRVPGLAFEDWT
ncbi:MAG: type II toxin-antitoxin system VapC family toxin [Burkholderiales bacterium]